MRLVTARKHFKYKALMARPYQKCAENRAQHAYGETPAARHKWGGRKRGGGAEQQHRRALARRDSSLRSRTLALCAALHAK